MSAQYTETICHDAIGRRGMGRHSMACALRPSREAPNDHASAAMQRPRTRLESTGDLAIARQVHIDVVSKSPTLLAEVSKLLADERTAVNQHREVASLHEQHRPDLIVLDRPVLDNPCFDLRCMRRKSVTTEIVVLRAHDAADVVRLLDAGADDATTASDTTCTSRLHAHARRARTRTVQEKTEFADLCIDRDANRVMCAGEPVSLTSIEAALLRCLFAKAPAVVSTKALADFVWGVSDTRDRRAVIRVYIGYLRDKLHRSRYATIRSVHGIGYQLANAADQGTGHI